MLTNVVFKVAHMFGAIGGGAKGFKKAQSIVGNMRATFRCIGSIDVDARVDRVPVATIQKERSDKSKYDVTLYENSDWRDEIDMPVRAMKPVLIEAVGKALELKIFDALGIAPAYRAADPIIAGQIRRPDNKGVITFFVAWWLDEQDL